MLIRQIAVRPERVDLQILAARLAAVLGIAPAITGSADQEDANILTLSVAAQLRRRGKEMTMRIERSDTFPARPNPSLIKLIVRAHLFKARLLQSAGGKFADLARREKLNRSYYSRVVRLTYLAPDITRAILEGRQPPGLTAATLLEHSGLPLAWPEQRKALGFTRACPRKPIRGTAGCMGRHRFPADPISRGPVRGAGLVCAVTAARANRDISALCRA